MAKVMVFDFGTHDNKKCYRINGEKADLERLLNEMEIIGADLLGFETEKPIIEHVHKGLYSVYFKIKLAVGVGVHDKDKNTNERDAFEKIYNNL